jgi:hypothetical protein
MTIFTTTVTATVATDLPTTFRHLTGMDVPAVFRGAGPLPAVTAIRNQTGDWDAVGQTRTIVLSDQSTASETLDNYQFPHTFGYTVTNYTSVLRLLVTKGVATWHCTSTSDGTLISWQYAYHTRSLLAVPVVWLLMVLFWKKYMRAAVNILQTQLQAAPTQSK